MSNSLSIVILLLLTIRVWSQETRNAASGFRVEHVWLISADGLSPDGFLSGDSNMHTDYHRPWVPLLRELVQNGVFAAHLIPVLPADSYPSELSIATGCNPGTHGVVTNKAWDPLEINLRGWRWYAEDIRVPTLWDLARSRGLTTALVGWPGTVGAHADLLVPDFWRANTSEDAKLLRAMSTDTFIREASTEYPDLTDELFSPESRDEAVTDLALYAIQTKQPNLLMLHLIHPVFAQHVYGPLSDEADSAFEDTDRQIGRLIQETQKAGIWNNTVIVVVSSFSFRNVSHKLYPGTLLAQSGLVTLDENKRIRDWKAVLISNDGTAYVYIRDSGDLATMQRVWRVFDTLVSRPDSGIKRIISQPEISKLGGDPQAFLAIEAADGFTIEDGYDSLYEKPADEHGTHGFLPNDVTAQGTALIYGPQINRALIDNARLIDIAPTIAQWLNLDLQKADGVALKILPRRLH